MSTGGISPALFVPAGKAILLAGIGYQFLQAARGANSFTSGIERTVGGLVLLLFFEAGGNHLLELSDLLRGVIARQAGSEDIKALVLESFKSAAKSGSDGSLLTSVNVSALIEQAWRTGVWGAMSTIVDGLFLLVGFILESAFEVIWTLLLVLFPLAAGVFPLVPAIARNMATYAVELALWRPMLELIESVAAKVARTHMQAQGEWGLSILATEVVSCILILSIPLIAHRFVSAGLSGDFASQAGIFKHFRTLATSARIRVEKGTGA